MLSVMLDLTLAFMASLEAELPALVDEINAAKRPDIPIVVPKGYELGIRTDMLRNKLDELPVLAADVYLRTSGEQGQQDFSYIVFPATIDIYLGHADATTLNIQAMKWALVLDQWVERFARKVIADVTGDEAPDIEKTPVLRHQDKTYRQLVTATFIFSCYE